MPQSDKIAGGLTAELGRGLGFGYRAGPPRSFSFWVLRITVHGGLVIYLGQWRLALEVGRNNLREHEARVAQLQAALESERMAHDETLVRVSELACQFAEVNEETLASRGR